MDSETNALPGKSIRYRKGCLFYVAVVACVGGITLLGAHLCFRGPGVTIDNFYRLRVGMTQDQVEAILGGREQTRVFVTDSMGLTWKGKDCSITVWIVPVLGGNDTGRLKNDRNGRPVLKYVARECLLTTPDGKLTKRGAREESVLERAWRWVRP